MKSLILPPFSLYLVLLAFCASRWARGSRLAVIPLLVTVLLFVMAMPVVADALSRLIGPPGPMDYSRLRTGAEMIVVFSAGVYRHPVNPASDTPDATTLERLQAAAALHRKTGLPILVSGGSIAGQRPIADVMRDSLVQDFAIAPGTVLAEGQSADTFENTCLTDAMLRPRGIRRVALVTDYLHMARARHAMEAAGYTVDEVRTGAFGRSTLLGHLVPQIEGLEVSYASFHELIGDLWYRTVLLPSYDTRCRNLQAALEQTNGQR